MRSDSTPLPEPGRPGLKSKRARLLMPIAVAVAALAIFLLLFWSPDHGRKGGKGHSGRSGEGRGGPSESHNGSSPVGGGSRNERPAKKGESWWYKEKEDKPEKEAGGWWYKDKPEGSGSEKDAVDDSRSPVGGQ
jgi:hypothetical protein